MAYRIVSWFLRQFRNIEQKVFARPAKRFLDSQTHNYTDIIEDLLDHPEVQYTKNIDQHRYHTRFEHMMLASKFAYYFATKTGADVRICVRAAAIHDVWTQGVYSWPAVEFAKKIGEPKAVQQAIATHMVLNNPPRDKNGWVVAFADECAWGVEVLEWLRLSLRDVLRWLAELSPVNLK